MTTEAHPPVISVMLAVPDAAAAARWYSEALGATELCNLGGGPQHICGPRLVSAGSGPGMIAITRSTPVSRRQERSFE
jgi:catechol 2,3-dioxygenase-like lactoylglutathione lyase family enzyme